MHSSRLILNLICILKSMISYYSPFLDYVWTLVDAQNLYKNKNLMSSEILKHCMKIACLVQMSDPFSLVH